MRYYDQNAQEFFDRTIGIDMGDCYTHFLSSIPQGGKILDAGCGSGRDALHFKNGGYQVTAMDPSSEMVRLSSKLIGEPTLQLSFQQMEFCSEFDAVWSNAALLHVPYAQMRGVFEKIHRALKPKGIFYASFKLGSLERDADGRHFSDMDEKTIAPYLEGLFEIQSTWLRDDARGRACSPLQQWFHILCRSACQLLS
ncbi:MAG: class I SAM-dependent methyltransferase [Verrucomicrobia bacterium]|nr:class I SAM-dependent methyltransferase [Verrucomicrobiota bacterium]